MEGVKQHKMSLRAALLDNGRYANDLRRAWRTRRRPRVTKASSAGL